MAPFQNIEQKGTEAVRRLRQHKLANGLPFMINSKDLPTNQCYLEYPDGSIRLAMLTVNANDFEIVRELSPNEVKELRARFKLSA